MWVGEHCCRKHFVLLAASDMQCCTCPLFCPLQAARAPPPGSAALEQPWQLTQASGGQKLGVVALGAANLVGVLLLSSMLATPANAVALLRGGLGWVLGAMPLLQVRWCGLLAPAGLLASLRACLLV